MKPLLGKELNKLHQTDKPVFSDEELEMMLIKTPTEDIEDGKYCVKHFKLHSRYNHDWNDHTKSLEKLAIAWEIGYVMANTKVVKINSVTLTHFADEMDYAGCSYELQVWVSGMASN